MSEPRKIRPYEHLDDVELNELVASAADLRLRMATLNPGKVRETLVRWGCPKKVAVRMVTDPLMRAHAARFHLDVEDVLRKGDPEARERVEHVQAGWERLRARGAPESAEEAREREHEQRGGS